MDAFQDEQAVTNAVDAHILEVLVYQSDNSLSIDIIVYSSVS